MLPKKCPASDKIKLQCILCGKCVGGLVLPFIHSYDSICLNCTYYQGIRFSPIEFLHKWYGHSKNIKLK